MTPSNPTPYQLFQLERYGDVLPEQSGGGVQGVSKGWYEREVELRELQEPITATQTIHP